MTEKNNPEPEDGKTGLNGSRPQPHGRARSKPLSKAAVRALREAEERRRKRAADAGAEAPRPIEVDGREGPEPVRYGDWENKGRASDF